MGMPDEFFEKIRKTNNLLVCIELPSDANGDVCGVGVLHPAIEDAGFLDSRVCVDDVLADFPKDMAMDCQTSNFSSDNVEPTKPLRVFLVSTHSVRSDCLQGKTAPATMGTGYPPAVYGLVPSLAVPSVPGTVSLSFLDSLRLAQPNAYSSLHTIDSQNRSTAEIRSSVA